MLRCICDETSCLWQQLHCKALYVTAAAFSAVYCSCAPTWHEMALIAAVVGVV